ncbi:MAG: extracellular solute-binding protein [Oscillospiraceae bacterium]|jgi:raffinose/stachyose/melibiose transport system substrate-binding protein
MKVKKLLAIAASAAMMLSVFTACNNGGSGDGSSNGGSSDTPENVELKFVFNTERSTNEDLMVEEIYKALDDFNENNDKGITMNVEIYPDQQYPAKINALASANQMPDTLWQAPGAKCKEYALAGKFVDLTPYLDADQEWKDSFQDGAFVSVTFEDKIWAIPMNFAFACVFYNTELFDQAGVKAEDIKDWEDFLAACETLKGAGIQPITMASKDAWCIALFTSYLVQRIGGLDPVTAIANREEGFTFEQDCFVKAGEMTKELLDKGYIQPSTVGDSNDQAGAYFRNGEAAMFCMGSWAIGGFHRKDSKVVDKVGVFPFPTVEGGKGAQNQWIAKTDNIALGINGEHPELAIEWPKWMTADKAQKATAEVAGKVPITKVEFDADVAPKELQYVNDAMASMGAETFGFFDEQFGNALGNEWNNALQNIMSGTKTSEQAFKDLQTYATTQLEKDEAAS